MHPLIHFREAFMSERRFFLKPCYIQICEPCFIWSKFIKTLLAQTEPMAEFDERLWDTEWQRKQFIWQDRNSRKNPSNPQ